MQKFVLPMPNMYVGETEERQVKNANKEVIGIRTLIRLDYLGGYVLLDVDKEFADSLKPGTKGKASVQMEPSMSGRSVKDGKFAFIDTGFDNFKLIGFEPDK